MGQQRKGLGPNAPDPVRTPEAFAVPPPRGGEGDDRWTTDHIIELRTICGRLTETVTTLTAKITEQGTLLEQIRAEQKAGMGSLQNTLQTHQKLLWTAAGVALVIGVLTAGFGSKLFDTWMQVNDLLRRQPPVTAAPVTAPPATAPPVTGKP